MAQRLAKDPNFQISFNFTNAQQLRADDDLKDLYERFADGLQELPEILGISIDGMSCFVVVLGVGALLEGDFDLNSVRDTLANSAFNDDTYGGTEVWEGMSLGYECWVALWQHVILITSDEDSLKACIDVVESGHTSLYEDKDFQDVMNRLPNGIYIDCAEHDRFFLTTYDGLEFSGKSLFKEDNNTMNMTAICRFDTETAAREAMDEIPGDMADYERATWTEIHVTNDSEFLKVTAELSIEDMLDGW